LARIRLSFSRFFISISPGGAAAVWLFAAMIALAAWSMLARWRPTSRSVAVHCGPLAVSGR